MLFRRKSVCKVLNAYEAKRLAVLLGPMNSNLASCSGGVLIYFTVSDVLIGMIIKGALFWILMPYSSVEIQHFGVT
jgi:hypothetical protein